MLYELFRPFLMALPPELAHRVTLDFLQHAPWLVSDHASDPLFTQSVTAMGLKFRNPIGLAAGLDKNGECVEAFSRMGFGFVEIGTLTPKPQPGNTKPRLFRIKHAQALINRMGFNNAGVDYFLKAIKTQKYNCRLGVNIGKNKDTPLEQAYLDYVACFNKVFAVADYVTVNVSSPNTPGLRSLQSHDALSLILEHLFEAQQRLSVEHGKRVPLALKISPDLSVEQISNLAKTLNDFPIQAIIAVNTTTSRPSISHHPIAQEEGGLSGKPLADLSIKTLRALKENLQQSVDIISVGGIGSAQNVEARLAQGAQLIQIYTALIYQGPKLLKSIMTALKERNASYFKKQFS